MAADGTARPARKSDLAVRAVSALVMLAIFGVALWLGGWAWRIFAVVIAAGVFSEWVRLVHAITSSPVRRGMWNALGVVYISIAAATLVLMRETAGGAGTVLVLVGLVVATDVGAYFTGRAIGGPKIAPRISPSKTWAGLFGGMVLAALVMVARFWVGGFAGQATTLVAMVAVPAVFGAIAAVIAQTGDFFESWMKRRAGVKDSGAIIPGHGGFFDRVDGLVALCFVLGIYLLMLRIGGYV